MLPGNYGPNIFDKAIKMLVTWYPEDMVRFWKRADIKTDKYKDSCQWPNRNIWLFLENMKSWCGCFVPLCESRSRDSSATTRIIITNLTAAEDPARRDYCRGNHRISLNRSLRSPPSSSVGVFARVLIVYDGHDHPTGPSGTDCDTDLAPVHLLQRRDGPTDHSRVAFRGMNQTTTYTPLESLFLFQLLAKHGLVAEAFPRISDELNQNGFITQQESYDAERLSPEKLEHLARRLVREEQAREAEAAEKNGNGAGTSPTSRKRKLPSPSLPSLKDLQAQRDKLPQLVDKLYATYQADIIRRIREDEEALERLEREVEELETPAAPVNVVSQQESSVAKANGTAPAVDTKPAQPVRPNGHVSQTPVPVPISQAQSVGKPMTPAQPPVQQPILERKTPQPSPSLIPSVVRPPGEVRHITPGTRPSNINRPPSAPPSGLQHPQAAPPYGPPPAAGASQSPTPDGLQRPPVLPKSQSPAPNPSPQLQQPQTPGTFKWEPPFNPQHLPQPPQPPYNGQPIARPPSYPIQPQPGASQHPHQQHSQAQYARQTPQALAQPGRTSTPGHNQFSHPVLVPPQGPAQNAGQTPTPTRQPHQEGSIQPAQQYRHPAVNASGPASGTPIPAPQYAHQQPFHPVQPGGRQQLGSSQVQTPSRAYPGPPPTGHRPALAAPAHSTQPSKAQTPHSLPSTPVAQRPAQPPYIQPPHLGAQSANATRQPQRPLNPAIKPSAAIIPPIHPPSQPQTPLSASLSSHVIRGHGTKWTSTPTPSTPRMELSGYFDTQSPAYEPISPQAMPAQTAKTPSQQSGKKDGRKNMSKADASSSKVSSRLSRSAQKSSQVKESAEEPDIGRKIKNEEATPKLFEDAGDTTADESVHGKAPGTSFRATNKRKRQETPADRGPPAPPTHVLWTRSFNKVSQSALEQVTSHRHANMFAAPIKARDAPGYPDIILRPQDLRQIRSAINGGQRAAHALEKTLPDLDPSAMNVWLPISVDLIPPKGIINIAQLERELVHMFANSIMYNQDPDRGVGPSFAKPEDEDDNGEAVGYEVDENGIVKETRNMFLEVEKLLSDLRSEIERNAQPPTAGRTSISRGVSVAGGDVSNVEEDGDQQPGDAEAQSTVKRRRKA
ncbi:hypothetical protein SCUP234_03309 [Seiridium cupressi]